MARTYITETRDTWDKISKKVYGTEYNTAIIVDANARYSSIVEFTAGIRLVIPDLPETSTVNANPAPWV